MMLLCVWIFFSFIIKKFEYCLRSVWIKLDTSNEKKNKKSNCAFRFSKKLLIWLYSADKNEIQFYIRKIRFFLYFFIKNLNFFLKWNFFEMLCSRWIWIFEHVCFFDKLFRHQIFFSLWIVRSNFIIFFLSFENVIWKITLFEFSFFRSIWKCDVINQKRIFDDVATSYLTNENQTQTRSIIKFKKWCWMNIIFTWWKMIQSKNFSSFKKHIKIFISFVFFFDKFFSISDFWQFKSLNLIKQFQLFSKISKKTVFQIIFRNVRFFSFSTDSTKCYNDDFAKFQLSAFAVAFFNAETKRDFRNFKKIKKSSWKKIDFFKNFCQFYFERY